jgi:1-acyl-sn-glycerol-3-phosphate acyltransferase
MFLRLLQWVCNLLIFVVGSKKITGRENLPASGPYIVVTNHMSASDLPLLCVAIPPDQMPQLLFFAAEKWEHRFLLGTIMRKAGAIYINRGAVDRRALRKAVDAIEEGAIFGLAPEGTRSRVGKMMRAREGAAYLASRAGVPLVPVGLVNTDTWSANFKSLRRTHFELHIGKPFHLPDVGRRTKGKDLEAYTHLIMVEIAALIPARYHGYYQDSPALAARLRGEDPWPYCQEVTAWSAPDEGETEAEMVGEAGKAGHSGDDANAG